MGKEAYVAYVGTYTRSSSIGIHIFDIDTDNSIEKVPFLRHFLFFVCALLRTDSLQKSILQYL